MGAPLGITRTDYTRRATRSQQPVLGWGAGSSDPGHCHGAGGTVTHRAAELNGMDRQTLRDWVHRYNALGSSGLEVAALSRPGADLDPFAEGGIARPGDRGPRSKFTGWCAGGVWTCKQKCARRFGVKCMRTRSPDGCMSFASHACNRAPFTRKRTRRPRRLLKKLLRPGQSRAPPRRPDARSKSGSRTKRA